MFILEFKTPSVLLTDLYRFLYILFIAIDACFRLRRRLVSSEAKDPGLGTGMSYFVEDRPYREYLLTVTDQKEVGPLPSVHLLPFPYPLCSL